MKISSKSIAVLAVLATVIPLFFLCSCQKKARLAVSTVNIVIGPDAGTTKVMDEKATQSFTAAVTNSKGALDLNPAWVVSSAADGTALGTFSPATGKSVTFTAGINASTGTVFATADGIISNSIKISVVPPGGIPHPIYTDSWLSVGLYQFQGDHNGSSLTVADVTTSPHSGTSCYEVDYATATEPGFAGIAFDFSNGAGDTSFPGKSRLTFWAKTNGNGALVTFYTGCGSGAPSATNTGGADCTIPAKPTPLTTSWTKYTITLTGNTNQINTLFAFAIGGADNQTVPIVKFFLDDIQFE